MRFNLVALLISLAFASAASAQLLTSTIDVEDGDTVLVSRTTNRLGATSFRTISTLVGGVAAAPAATTATTDTTLRVVGQPQATTSSRPQTVFEYTTNGVVRTGTFTASFAPTLTPPEPSEGTRFDYSAYTALIGPSLSAQVAAASLAAAQSGGGRIASVLGSSSSAGVLAAGVLVGAGALFVNFV